jgi:hypothetical protein
MVYLSALKLVVNTPINFHFSNDGKVADIIEHTLKLNQKYSFKQEEPYFEDIGDTRVVTTGRNYIFCKSPTLEDAVRTNAQIYNHIFYLEFGDKKMRTWIRGHEETHTLLHLGQINRLKKALAKYEIQSDTLDTLSEEAICGIGGLLACLKRYSEPYFPSNTDFSIGFESTNWFLEHIS